MRWVLKEQKSHPWLNSCAEVLHLPKEVVNLISQLSFADEKEFMSFFVPTLKDVEDPSKIQNLARAVECIDVACKANQKIAIVSDYDVDGITSMALMKRCFDALGFTFCPFFPNRDAEGYGLTERLVDRILSNASFDFLIALDCGTNSIAAIEKLNMAGIQVIVVDHHQHNCEKLPKAIVVNPHVDSHLHSKSSQNLCSVGLVFKWVHAWLKRLKSEKYGPALEMRLRHFLDLVALGTVADLVPLRDENRLWVYFGLREMVQTQLIGLKKLLEVSGCNLNFPLNVEDVSFKLAPRINVSGRLDSADMPYQLLTSDDEVLCQQLAETLNNLNGERQKIERNIVKEAEAMILARPHRWAYVLYKEDWHVGVVGIVAGKLSRKFNCPVFVLGLHEGKAKGSGRSIPEVNLVEMFSSASSLIAQWGGHPAAVGLSIEINKIQAVEDFFNDYLKKFFPASLPEPTLNIAAVMRLEKLTSQFLNNMDRLAPFGQGNEMPVFVIENVILGEDIERFGQQGTHLRFKLNNFSVIGWGLGHSGISSGQAVDLAVCCGWSYWQTARSIQLQLIDWHPHVS